MNKKIPFGIGVITSRVASGSYLSYDEIRDLEKAGCEIMSHSHLHSNLMELTKHEIDVDISTSLSLLRQNGFNPTSFIYPYNANNDKTEKIVRKYFNFAYTKAVNTTLGRNYPSINNQAINRVALGSFFDSKPQAGLPTDTTSLEYYKARVDECKLNSNLLVFVIHSEPTWEEQMFFLLT